jgi:hemerythrin-like domain-containing protein
MTDHEIISQALRVLDVMAAEIRHGKDANIDDIRSLLVYLRDFADGCHHVKEEAIFFPALMQAGMPLDEGPLRVMNLEHERGRALTAAMQAAIDRGRLDDFVVYASRYTQLLSEHIEKENRVLFEKANQILSDEEDEKIAAAFDHFETNITGTLTEERLRQIIGNLTSKYLAAAA